MGIYEELMEVITGYTGLSPAAFFTIGGMAVVVYRMVSSMFVGPADDYINSNSNSKAPPVAAIIDSNNSSLANKYFSTPRESVQVGDMTEQQLRGYDGSDPGKPILMAIRAQIYDVSSSRNFYGPGGPYAMFAGRDASRALALLSFKPQDITGNIQGLGPEELDILQDWEDKFQEKYVKVGQLVPDPTQTQQTDQVGDEAQ